jgi:hypothetical protein
MNIQNVGTQKEHDNSDFPHHKAPKHQGISRKPPCQKKNATHSKEKKKCI